MKNLKTLGKILSSSQQKSVFGGGLEFPKKACKKPSEADCCKLVGYYEGGKFYEELKCGPTPS